MISFDDHIPDFITRIISENRYDNLFVLTDSNTFPVFNDYRIQSLPQDHLMVIPAGEQHKNLATAASVWEFLAKHGAGRHAALICFGGGVVTDLGGFCASTYMRGIDHINIPTTLLCMVDAAVGGKTGINLMHLKNYVGTFSEPKDVCADVTVLKNLDRNELVNGWAEVIKHGVISGGELWDICRKPLPEVTDTELWKSLVRHNIETKEKVVAADPSEKGLRRILNFGHSVGHAIETAVMNSKGYIGHGPAVAAGMIIESVIAEEMALLSKQDLAAITKSIDTVFERIALTAEMQESITALVQSDKKNRNNTILMSLPAAIGDVRQDIRVTPEFITKALKQYVQP